MNLDPEGLGGQPALHPHIKARDDRGPIPGPTRNPGPANRIFSAATRDPSRWAAHTDADSALCSSRTEGRAFGEEQHQPARRANEPANVQAKERDRLVRDAHSVLLFGCTAIGLATTVLTGRAFEAITGVNLSWSAILVLAVLGGAVGLGWAAWSDPRRATRHTGAFDTRAG